MLQVLDRQEHAEFRLLVRTKISADDIL